MGKYLEVKNISKSFPGVKALNNVSLTINEGEIYGLVGENGSGKSTLVKIISGNISPNPGGYLVTNGEKFVPLHSIEALRKGIVTIFQDFSLFENLTASENISITLIPEKGLNFINWRQIKENAQKTIKKLDVDIDLNEQVENLSTANQQIVEIARAINCDAKLIIMDEPTSTLSQKEVKILFNIMKNLKAAGISILFISHKLDEVLEIVDTISILRDGNLVGTYAKKNITSKKMISLMTGKKIDEFVKFKPQNIGKLLLEIRNLSKKGNFKDINLKLGSGEILGITGLMGSGKTEFAQSLFGMNKPESGGIYLEGKKVEIKSPDHAKKLGIAYISENKKESLFMSKPVSHNIIVTVFEKVLNKLKLISEKKIGEVSDSWIKKLRIKIPSRDMSVLYLSGGNQKRVLISKWLVTNTKILILDNPTAGIDVKGKEEIFEILHNLANQGMAIILITPEVLEVLANCNRILVMRKGKFVKEFQTTEATKEKIMEKSMIG
ncbi:Galactose/methyl galactoside import ATP-binding protein MglA [subsurface metagenome]